MKLTYYGHSAFGVEILGKKLLFDPFITGNSLAKDKVDISKLEPDYILVSHAHQDHIGDAEAIAKSSNATVIAHFEICSRLEKNGLKNLHPLGIGGKFEFDFGTVKMTVAHHSSSFADGSYGGNPNGFIVLNKEKNFYYSGDTGLTLDMLAERGIASLIFALDEMKLGKSEIEFLSAEKEMLVPAGKIIIVSPEYNGSYPGVLKVMIDISDRANSWYWKKILLVGISSGRAGNLRGMEHLTGVLQYLNCFIHPNKLPISSIDKLTDDDGRINDAATLAAIEQQIDQFISF